MEDVFSYEMDFTNKTLAAYTLFGDNKYFKLGDVKKIEWAEKDSSLVISGGIESIVQQ